MGEKLALIIAVSQYQDAALRQLIAPAQDAEALARVLANPAIGGFQVQTLVNETSSRVNLEIETFCDNRKHDDLLVLYFSGHGIKDTDGQLYFATTDTQLVRHSVRRATAVAASFVNQVMSHSRSRRQILLLDCCYSGAFKEGMLAKAGGGVGVGEYFEGRGRVVLTASNAFQYSFEGEQVEGEGIRSVFTRRLVQGLETGEADLDRDGAYSLDEVYDYLYARVSDEQPEQKPMKMGFVEGKIFIGNNPCPRSAELPPELQESLQDHRPWVRKGAVPELEKLLAGSNKGLALAARDALTALAMGDDSFEVRIMAEKYLAASAEGRLVSGPTAVPTPHAAEALVMNGWTLNIQGERDILNPSLKQIKDAIRSITPGPHPFLILQKGSDGLTYMQAMLEDDSLWSLEYQDGSLGQHFLASTELSTEEAIGLFLAFVKGDKAWHTSVKWERLDIGK
jgi:Caspase domain